MVDTFTCDSCGKNNVPTDDKSQILLKSVQPTGGVTAKGKQQKATVTIGQEVCPDCKMFGVVRNHIKVSKDGEPERFFTWNPRKDMESVYEWGQQKAQATQGTK